MSAGESVAFDRIAGTYDATRGGLGRGRGIAAVVDRLLPPSGPVPEVGTESHAMPPSGPVLEVGAEIGAVALAPSGAVLEVGVGTGAVAAGLTGLGRSVIGVDLSLPMLDQARDRLPGRLAAGDALRLPVGTGTVAAVVMIHVLHLVADVGAALAEAARVLRPGGTLVAGATPEEDPPGDVYEEVGRVSRRFGGPRPQAGVSAVLAAATAAGFTLTDRAAEPVIPLTPRNAAGMLESRSLSWIWSLDEEMWAREISPVLTRLRALPDQDRARFAPGPAVLAFTHP